jgi:hypothetical protein
MTSNLLHPATIKEQKRTLAGADFWRGEPMKNGTSQFETRIS